MTTRYLTLALALGVLASPLAAQAPARGDSAVHVGPAGLVLKHRQELALTDHQVSRLEQISQQHREKNAPVRAKLQALRQDSSFAKQSRREKRATMQPIMEEMRANSKAAREQVDQVLTDEQRTKARELVQADRQKMRERMRGHHGRRGPRGGSPHGES